MEVSRKFPWLIIILFFITVSTEPVLRRKLLSLFYLDLLQSKEHFSATTPFEGYYHETYICAQSESRQRTFPLLRQQPFQHLLMRQRLLLSFRLRR